MKRLVTFCLMFMTLALPAHAIEEEIAVELDKGKLIQMNASVRSVFIANPAIADVQMMASDSLMVFGRRTGETSLIVLDEHNRTILNRRIVVNQNLEGLRDTLRTVLPDAQVDATGVPNGIVLTGNVRSPAEAESARRLAARYLTTTDGEIINRIAVTGPTQVMLQVRVAEMARTVNKSLGLNWQAGSASNGGGFTFGRGANMFNPDNRYALVDPFSFLPLGDLVRPGGNDVFFTRLTRGNFSLNMMLDAMSTEGFISILAEPSLTAISGETASFLAGGEFPVPVPSENGIQIQYRSYGVSLAFTPTLLDSERISLRVRPEVSQLAASQVVIEGSEIPSLITRRAETTVEMASGQSFAIAGLLQNNSNQTTARFPGLGDLPVIGALFKSEAFTRDESELVIIVTPYIVRPVDERLASPVDGYDVPDDASRIFLDDHLDEVKAAPFARLIDEPISFFVE